MAISNEESTPDYLLLRDVSRHVKRLKLYDMTPKLIRYIELVEPHNFPNLRSLTVVTFLLGMGVIDLRVYLFGTLACTAHSLNHLRIQELSTKMAFSLSTILRIYSNLTSLQLDVWNIVDYSISHTTRLTRIDLKVGVSDRRYDIRCIRSLFEHSPQLRYLKLQYCIMQRYDVLSTLQDCCPGLTTLIINRGSLRRDIQISPQLIVPRLKRSTDTLKTLCFGPVDDIPSSNWEIFSSVTLPALTFLQVNLFHASAEFVRHRLPRILQRYPSLEILVLEQFMDHDEGAATDELFNTLIQLPRLSHLRLALFDIRGEGFPRFLRHHAENGSSLLQELSIFSCCGLTKIALQHIALLPKLKELAFRDVDYTVKQSDFNEFMELASQTMVQLSVLKLELQLFDDFQVAKTIDSFKKLTHIALT